MVATALSRSAAADRQAAAAVLASLLRVLDRSVAAVANPVSRRHSTVVVAAAEVRPVRPAVESEAAPRSRGRPVPDGLRLQAVRRAVARASPRSAARPVARRALCLLVAAAALPSAAV